MYTVLDLEIPPLNLSALAPVLVVLAGACLGILMEAFVPRRHRWGGQVVLAVVTIVAAFVVLVRNWIDAKMINAGGNAIVIDGPSYFFWAMLLIFALLAVCLFAERKLYQGGTVFASSGAALPGSEPERIALAAGFTHSEVFALAMFSLGGMMLFGSANDLVTMFVALEIMSLPLYLLTSLAGRRRLLSQEAGLKYFLLGSMSSAIFLFGIALSYAYAGSFEFGAIAAHILQPKLPYPLIYVAMAMLAVGLLFKIGAVPFHSWTPDVYMGAPTPVTSFMAVCTKIAAVFGLLRIFYVALAPMQWDWQLLLAVIAVLTMAVGSVIAVLQTDIKRMLAYSSIAHAGFILTAVAGAIVAGGVGSLQLNSIAAILFYLAVYGFASMGAFAIVTMVRHESGEANLLSAWTGLGKRKPFLAVAMSIFLLSFAGIPATSGFIGKWAVFASAWRGGYAWLVVIAVLCSLVAAFFYLRVIMVMFFKAPSDESAEVGSAGIATWVPLITGLAATVILGVYPGPVLDLAIQASQLLRIPEQR